MSEMRVLLLSPHPERLAPIFETSRDEVVVQTDPLETPPDADFIVSYGYRHIIPPTVLRHFIRKTVNIHIGYLPWNRGADPNFWSWFDNTPKGVTFHQIDKGVDTGDILLQSGYRWMDNSRTLRSTYDDLHKDVVRLFAVLWPMLRTGNVPSAPQKAGSTYHRSSDKDKFFAMLSRGWDTPVCEVEALGRKISAESEGQMADQASNIYLDDFKKT